MSWKFEISGSDNNDHFFDDRSNWSKSNIIALLRRRTFLKCKLVLQWNNFLNKQKKKKKVHYLPQEVFTLERAEVGFRGIP